MTTLRFVIAATACAWLAGCASTPPEEDPVVQKLTELDSRLLRIELKPGDQVARGSAHNESGISRFLQT